MELGFYFVIIGTSSVMAGVYARFIDFINGWLGFMGFINGFPT